MTRDKQIEEMAKALTAYEKKLCDRLPKDKCLLTSAVHAQVSCDYCKISEFLVNAGYRKASEVALEVIAEVEKIIDKYYNKHIFGDVDLTDTEQEAVMDFSGDISYDLYSLKKKYAEGEG